MPRTTKHPQKAVYIPQELLEQWKRSAERNHRSMNAEIIVALEFYLEAQEERKNMYKLQTFEGNFEGYGNIPIHPVGEVVEVNGTLNQARAEAKRLQHEGKPEDERIVTIWENGLAKEGGRSVEEVNPWTERNYRHRQ
jgi:hypothetical protein